MKEKLYGLAESYRKDATKQYNIIEKNWILIVPFNGIDKRVIDHFKVLINIETEHRKIYRSGEREMRCKIHPLLDQSWRKHCEK